MLETPLAMITSNVDIGQNESLRLSSKPSRLMQHRMSLSKAPRSGKMMIKHRNLHQEKSSRFLAALYPQWSDWMTNSLDPYNILILIQRSISNDSAMSKLSTRTFAGR
jgi:hypothetical protein